MCSSVALRLAVQRMGSGMSVLSRIENAPRRYPWGIPGGISELLGWPDCDLMEAELWLGSHSLSPSRLSTPISFETLEQWERQAEQRLPFLFKVLAAAEPLSLQVHPSSSQARDGHRREQASGIPLKARGRNYKDAHAKPEMIVAVRDGFEALCGFRPPEEVIEAVAVLESGADDKAPFACWRSLITGVGLASGVEWLLSGDPLVGRLMAELGRLADRPSADLAVARRLLERYPSDPGIAVSLMLNHVVLQEGEALWLAAGTIHAYLGGVGVELMGPSDNVLRGGLTAKHIDVPELLKVLDFGAGPPPYLVPIPEGPNVRSYLPSTHSSGRDVEFWLREVTGDAQVRTSGPAILLVIAGDFEVGTSEETEILRRGEALFCSDAGDLTFKGSGRAFIAAT